MFCTKCGTQLPEGTKFCPVCGSPLGAEKKKGVLSIFFKLGTAAAWVIGILFVIGLFIGDDPVDRVKNVVFDQYGTITVGEMVERNFRGAEWSYETLDEDSAMVYVSGYVPAYYENIRLSFYYEDLNDGTYRCVINSIYLPDSGENVTDVFMVPLLFGLLYEVGESATGTAS